MNEIINQWERVAERFAADQKRSEYADINKVVIKRRFQRFNGEKLLDLGCGYGYYTEYFDGIGAHTVGIDGAKTMIRIAREKYPNGVFSIVDLTYSLPFEDATFDLVFCNQVLMDIKKIDDVFNECYRVLNDNGIFYYSIVHPAFYNGVWQVDKNGFKYAKAVSRYLSSSKYRLCSQADRRTQILRWHFKEF